MTSAREAFLAAAAERILITDGAFGTEIQNRKLAEADYAGTLGLTRDQKGNNDILALTRPEVPESITGMLAGRGTTGRSAAATTTAKLRGSLQQAR